MPFEKGKQKTGGKVKGSKNVKTVEWEQLGDFLTDKGAKRAMKVLDELDDESYLDQYGKLLNYFKPKMQSSTLDANVRTETIIVNLGEGEPNG
jgi:hypothetical protein